MSQVSEFFEFLRADFSQGTPFASTHRQRQVLLPSMPSSILMASRCKSVKLFQNSGSFQYERITTDIGTLCSFTGSDSVVDGLEDGQATACAAPWRDDGTLPLLVSRAPPGTKLLVISCCVSGLC